MKPPYDVRGKSGIYCIIHKDSGMCYVGSSVDMEKRRKEHLANQHSTLRRMLYRMLREFGEDAFDFEVLLECPKEQLLERERFYIVLLNAASIEGMNVKSHPHANYNIEISESTRARLREARRGKICKPLSDKSRKLISKTLKKKGIRPPSRNGISPSKESIEKQRNALKGRKFSDEHINRLREAAKNRSADHLAKVQAAKIGKPRSEECKAKIHAALSGRKLTPEHRAKVIKTLKHKKSANLAESGL